MTDDPATLVSRLHRNAGAADVVRDRFSVWWTERDDRASATLDLLAADAGGDDQDAAIALELLISLVAQHGVTRPALRRYLLAEHDIADAEQATLAAVGLKVSMWDERSRFTTWLHRVAENEAKMLIRARERRPSTPVADPQPSPFVARLSTLLADRDVVDRAIATLADDLRTPLTLREIDGLGYDEIAARLDLQIGTVRSRLHRARSILLVALRAELDAG